MANNRIQIKRSTTTAITNTTPSINAGELVFTSNGYVLAIGDPANSANVISIGGARFPGVLTANQALVANSTSGIDKVIVANLAANSVWANGSAGTDGQVLTSNGTVVFWKTPAPGVAGSDTQVQFNDGGALAGDAGFTFNKTTDALTVNGSLNVLTSTIANTSGLFTTGTVNGATLSVGTSVVANSTRLALGTAVGLQVNGSIGSAGQILYSNGTTAYWAAAPTGDITAVTAGSGLTGGGTAGDVTLDVGAGNGIVVSADAVAVLANNGIVANSTGVFAAAANGISVTAAGINVVGGDGLVSNATGVHIGQGNGIAVSADSIRVQQANAIMVTAGGVTIDAASAGGLIANTTGLHVRVGNGLVSNTTGLHILTTGDTTLIANASGLFVNDATLSIATSQLTGDVALGTQTSGNYVATVAAGNGMVVAGSGAETAAVTVSVLANTGVTANSTGIFIGQPVSTTSNVTFANVVTTLFTSSGNTILGTTSADTLNTRGSFSNNLMPSANATYDIGTNAMRWGEVHATNVHSVTGYFDGNVQVGGDIIVTGNLVTQNVQSVVISDPMIYLAGNNYVSDLVDIGFSANYYDGATQRHTGFFRDATDGIYKLFANSTQELSGNNVVNTTATGYVTASLVAYLQSSGLTTNATSVYVTANSTVNVNISANVISLSGRANNDLLFSNSTGGITGLALGTSGYVVQSNGTAIVYDTLDGGTF